MGICHYIPKRYKNKTSNKQIKKKVKGQIFSTYLNQNILTTYICPCLYLYSQPISKLIQRKNLLF